MLENRYGEGEEKILRWRKCLSRRLLVARGRSREKIRKDNAPATERGSQGRAFIFTGVLNTRRPKIGSPENREKTN